MRDGNVYNHDELRRLATTPEEVRAAMQSIHAEFRSVRVRISPYGAARGKSMVVLAANSSLLLEIELLMMLSDSTLHQIAVTPLGSGSVEQAH